MLPVFGLECLNSPTVCGRERFQKSPSILRAQPPVRRLVLSQVCAAIERTDDDDGTDQRTTDILCFSDASTETSHEFHPFRLKLRYDFLADRRKDGFASVVSAQEALKRLIYNLLFECFHLMGFHALFHESGSS